MSYLLKKKMIFCFRNWILSKYKWAIAVHKNFGTTFEKVQNWQSFYETFCKSSSLFYFIQLFSKVQIWTQKEPITSWKTSLHFYRTLWNYLAKWDFWQKSELILIFSDFIFAKSPKSLHFLSEFMKVPLKKGLFRKVRNFFIFFGLYESPC